VRGRFQEDVVVRIPAVVVSCASCAGRALLASPDEEGRGVLVTQGLTPKQFRSVRDGFRWLHCHCRRNRPAYAGMLFRLSSVVHLLAR
jgi:hypothetical protein